jgi:hypothetical protein
MKDIVLAAARSGHIQVLDWACSTLEGMLKDGITQLRRRHAFKDAKWAASSGHVIVFKWLKSRGLKIAKVSSCWK